MVTRPLHRAALLGAVVMVVGAAGASCSGRTGPKPRITSVSPAQGANSIDIPITIDGSGFSPMPTDATSGSAGVDLPRVFLLGSSLSIELEPVEFVTSHQLRATVPAGIAIGVYAIKVENPNGRSTTLAAAYEAIEPDILALTGVVPRFGWVGEATPVQILGGVFQSTPRAYLQTSPETELDRVAFLDSGSLFAEVPPGITPGTYALRVVNPDGGVGVLGSAFTVTVDPPPHVDAVTPSNGTTQADTPVTIIGSNFPADATVDLVDAAGNLTTAVVTSITAPSTIQATIPSTALAIGNYLVRVTRPADGAYGEYAVFTVTGPSGNPGPWEDLSALPGGGRRGLSAVIASDDRGRNFLYAVGGQVTDTAGNVLTVFQNSAVAPLNAFGRPGNWRDDGSLMSARRFEPVAWVTSGYVFVAGGVDEMGAYLADVERAKVLRSAGAPLDLDASQTGAGSLPGGAWYYRVSAVVSDPDNAGGETLPSDFAVINVAQGSEVTLSWTAPVEGAVTSYNVYRTPTANGALGQEQLLANVAGSTFVDDGTASPTAGTTVLAPGSLGNWIALGSLAGGPRGRATVSVGRAKSGAAYAGSFVYVIGGEDGAGLRDDYEYAVVGSNGFLGGFVAGGAGLTDARREAFASVADAFSAPLGVTEPDSFVYLVGGEGPTLGSYTTAIEVGTISTNGSLAWVVIGDAGKAGAAQVSAVASDYVWFIGGKTNTVSTSVFTGEICRTGLGGCAGALAPELRNVNNTGEALPDPRAQAGGVRFRGYIYVVGGTSDGLDTVPGVIASVF